MDDQGEFSQFIDGLKVGWHPLLRGIIVLTGENALYLAAFELFPLLFSRKFDGLAGRLFTTPF